MKSLSAWIPRRFATLLVFVAAFLVINTLVRAFLLIYEADMANLVIGRLFTIFGAGLVYDLAAASWFLIPLVLIATIFPNNRFGRLGHAWLASVVYFGLLVTLLFTAVSELLFWNEFSSRFNFIAVDYLVYTREVLGNIEQSYHVPTILGGIAFLAVLIAWAVRKPFWVVASSDGGTWPRRWVVFFAILLMPAASFYLISDGLKERQGSTSASELAANGDYELFRAFRVNKLDYPTFYRMLPESDAQSRLREQFVAAHTSATFLNSPDHPIERRIQGKGPQKKLNVVMVSIESMGADYVESFGGEKGWTPNLDRLAHEGMMFTQTYATGLRTVRGLEALTLSMPPTPGHAVVMRKNNKGFQTVGEVFRDNGYQSLYLYGGYSYFDNMKDFFGGNGYTVIDRTDIPDNQISHETIWGVADEDLFRKTISELDARTAAGKRVFAHVMTTSNHRPYTYPDGRIATASGSGREGAVRYTDWAIGQFVKEASARPWFKDTVFVFVADHTSHGRGRTDLPPENFHIPFIIWSPDHIAPSRVDTVASQIDVAPTVLALLNFSYTSNFFGQDILDEGRYNQRALMANYLTVGSMKDGLVVQLSPKRKVQVVDAVNGRPYPAQSAEGIRLVDDTVSYYQVASKVLSGGRESAAPLK